MSRWARAGLLLATLAGLAIALWVLRSLGLEGVAAAARRLGWGGFVLYCSYSLVVFGILGAAWLASAPGEPGGRLALFGWARLVREAVSDLLPFSQIGGLVVGARVLLGHGVPARRVYASMVVDLTTEMAGQLLFTLFGLATMASVLAGDRAAALRPIVFGGTAALALLVALLFVGQRWMLAFASRLAGRLLPGVVYTVGAIDAELARTYAQRRRVALAFALNLLAWIASAAGAWLLLRLSGTRLSLLSVLAIESLIFTVRSVAFAVPGAIGFQEAAYAVIGPLFGLPAEAALALSLGKRARDLTLSLPTLLWWQARELRAMLRPAKAG